MLVFLRALHDSLFVRSKADHYAARLHIRYILVAQHRAASRIDHLALGAGDKERGIRLWAAARRIQKTIGTGLVEAQLEAGGVNAWREPKPDDATPERRAELEAEGRAWTLEEALAYALGDTVPEVGSA